MDTLLPGFPETNPILKGICAILSGADPETAMLERDRALPGPIDFARAALEALAWIQPGSVVIQPLLEQATAAFKRATPAQRSALLRQINTRPASGASADLIDLWCAVEDIQ